MARGQVGAIVDIVKVELVAIAVRSVCECFVFSFVRLFCALCLLGKASRRSETTTDVKEKLKKRMQNEP